MFRRMWLLGVVGLVAACAERSAPVQFEDRAVSLPDGDTIRYTTTGLGKDTIVVLPGGPAWSSAYLREPLASLAESHVLLFIDLPGRGHSSVLSDSASATLDHDLDDFAAFTRQLGLGHLDLVGHGYGAGVAAMYSVRHPGQVDRLLLLSPMFTHVNLVWQGSFQPNDSIATSRYLVARRLGRDTVDATGFCRSYWGFDLSPMEETDTLLVHRLSDNICNASPINLEQRAVVHRGIRRSLGSWDWRDSLRTVSSPALVVQGDHNLFLKRTAESWSELLPHSTFHALAGNPHFPWIQSPAEFRRVISDFLLSPTVMASQKRR